MPSKKKKNLVLPPKIIDVFNMFESIGLPAWLAGGSLRDLLLGTEPHDWDFASPFPPEETEGLLVRHGVAVFPTGLAHGTLTFRFERASYEITSFRLDGPYEDHRHPTWVQFTSNLQEDLSRRDFTINAMAYSPQGGLQDPFEGQQDLDAKLIRCVGNADQRFREDALRILRGIRLAAQLGFELEPDTAWGMESQAELLKKISQERIRDELDKMLLSEHPDIAFKWLKELELWPYILPEMAACINFDQHSDHHFLDIYDHTMVAVQNTPPKLELRLGALFHDIAKPATFTIDSKGKGHFYGHQDVGVMMAQGAMARLRYSKALQKKVGFLVENHMLHLLDMKDITLKRFISQAPRPVRENLEELFLLQEADLRASANQAGSLAQLQTFVHRCYQILDSDCPLTLRQLAINGRDLEAMGIPPRTRGVLLNQLLDLVLAQPNLNERSRLLKHAEKFHEQLVTAKIIDSSRRL